MLRLALPVFGLSYVVFMDPERQLIWSIVVFALGAVAALVWAVRRIRKDFKEGLHGSRKG